MRRRMLASIGGMKMPTARDYVQDGLIAMWDGKENAGWGVHDETATDWVDLTGGGRNWTGIVSRSSTYGNTYWGDDHLAVYKRQASDMSWTIGTVAMTLEVCGWSEASGSYLLFGLGAENRIFSILPTNDRGFQFASNAPAMFQPHNADWTASATYSETGAPGHTYYNGEEKPHTAGTSSWRIGSVAQWIPNQSYPFKGKVRSIRVYNRVLTASEIAANYAVDKARFNLS